MDLSSDRFLWEMRRGRFGPMPEGLIRWDRALLYFRTAIQEHIRELQARKTKGIGDYSYRLSRFAREMLSILSMSGEGALAETVFRALSRLNPRTSRSDGLKVLQDLLASLESHASTSDPEDVNQLKTRLAELEERLLEEDTSKEPEVAVSDPKTVFVIMPFRPELTDVWKGAIQRAATDAGLTAIRVDMINRSSNITDDIVKSIDDCHIAIADVTENNPNVMFELGYALARNKPNIIISQSANYLPFDIRNIRTIVYTNSWSGIEELRGKLKDFLRESSPVHQVARRAKAAPKRPPTKSAIR